MNKGNDDIKIWKFKDKWRIVKGRKVIWTCDSEFIFSAIDFYKKSAIENTQEESKNELQKGVYSILSEPKENQEKPVSKEEVQKELNKLMGDILKK